MCNFQILIIHLYILILSCQFHLFLFFPKFISNPFYVSIILSVTFLFLYSTGNATNRITSFYLHLAFVIFFPSSSFNNIEYYVFLSSQICNLIAIYSQDIQHYHLSFVQMFLYYVLFFISVTFLSFFHLFILP